MKIYSTKIKIIDYSRKLQTITYIDLEDNNIEERKIGKHSFQYMEYLKKEQYFKLEVHLFSYKFILNKQEQPW